MNEESRTKKGEYDYGFMNSDVVPEFLAKDVTLESEHYQKQEK